ncbi:hypothetical protein D3C86_1764800 [compost metagenome]
MPQQQWIVERLPHCDFLRQHVNAEATVIADTVTELADPVALGLTTIEQLDQTTEGGSDGVGLHTVAAEDAPPFVRRPHG